MFVCLHILRTLKSFSSSHFNEF